MDDKFFFDWYQRALIDLVDDEGSLIYLFSQLTGYDDYNKNWCQNCLDFVYRVITCKICNFEWSDVSDVDILQELLKSNPKTIDGYAIWSAYQIILTREGKAFLLKCGVNGKTEAFSPLLKERMSALFAEHGVGFDKKDFIPVQF